MKNSNQTSGTVNINIAYNGSRPRVRISFNWSNIWQSIVSGISSFFKVWVNAMVTTYRYRNVIALTFYALLWYTLIAMIIKSGMDQVEYFRSIGAIDPFYSTLSYLWSEWKNASSSLGFTAYGQQIGLLILAVIKMNLLFMPAMDWTKNSLSILHHNNWKVSAAKNDLVQCADGLKKQYQKFVRKVMFTILGVAMLTATVYFVWNTMQTAM